MDPLPYNVTISSQTASISYSPAREGAMNSAWNSTYSAGAKDTGYGRAQGLGTDYHRTTRSGASLEFRWTGTAVYLYGNATAGSYSISIDGQDIGTTNDVPQGGLMGSKTGLKYGDHAVKLTVLGKGEVAFQYAQATIGVGYNGNNIQNRTVYATNEQPTAQPNPFFNWGNSPGPGSWQMEPIRKVLRPDGSSYEIPRQMVTSTTGDTLTFTVNRTSAFFLWGAVNWDHQPGKRATITSTGGQAQSRDTSLDDESNYLDFEQIIYWESGLDPDQNYTVQILNGGTGTPNFSFNRLELIDGGATPESAGISGGKVRSLSDGAIAGIVISCITSLLLIIGGFFLWRRRKRSREMAFSSSPQEPETAPTPFPYISGVGSSSLYTTTTSPVTPITPARATDAGPAQPLLPPEYQPGWSTPGAGSTPQGSEISLTSHGESGSRRQRPPALTLHNGGLSESSSSITPLRGLPTPPTTDKKIKSR
ncbi:hypothetical protein V5O48_006659 [Marasmius crinis-equi]|uniref:PA14 domain-containing protein n=1 Tax=Marasmius crinis-equi TaxID=585013 RepID=A0ABR3FJS4_9AGAR